MTEPIHIISLGAGVQSSTMALMAAAGDIQPMPVAAIFADTQAEPKSVYVWLDWLEKQLPFPVHRVTAGSLPARELKTYTSKKSGKVYRKSGVPVFIKEFKSGSVGILFRKCTFDFKISPITKWLRQYQGQSVIQWFGITTDESSRMKDSRLPWIQHRYPLIDFNMDRNGCLLWMEHHGHPKPPRSACVFCPYHNNKEWFRLQQEEPEDFKRAVDFEKQMQSASVGDQVIKGTPFLHRSCKPLSEVDFSPPTHEQISLFNNECEGMCGV